MADAIEIHESALIKEEDKEVIEEQGGDYNYFGNGEVEEEEEVLAAEEAKLEMPQLNSVWIAAGHEIEFEPGYLHLMLIGLRQDLRVGDHFILTLHFEHFGKFGSRS